MIYNSILYRSQVYIYTLVYTLNSLCKKLGKINGVTHVFLWSFHSYTQFLHGDACSVISLTPRGEKWLSKLRKNNLVYGLKQHQICKLIFSKHHICTLYKFVFFLTNIDQNAVKYNVWFIKNNKQVKFFSLQSSGWVHLWFTCWQLGLSFYYFYYSDVSKYAHWQSL